MDYVDPIMELATENRQLKAERDALAADNARLLEALHIIVLNATFRFDGAASDVLTNVRRTARDALNPPHGE